VRPKDFSALPSAQIRFVEPMYARLVNELPEARSGYTRSSSTAIAASLREMRVASRYGRGAKIFLSSLPRKFVNS
jgi:hypothetical protein